MSRSGPVTRAVVSVGPWPLIIFSPVIVLVGEPVSRYVMRRVRRDVSAAQMAASRRGGWPGCAAAVPLSPRTSLFFAVISNPLWIALTAPGRWAGDRFRRNPPRAGGPVSAP